MRTRRPLGIIEKYREHRHRVTGNRWYHGRDLSDKEIAAFRAHVEAEKWSREKSTPRMKRVVFDERAAGARTDVAGHAREALAKTLTGKGVI